MKEESASTRVEPTVLRAEPTGLRADAERNRAAIVQAAQLIYRDRGLDVSMNEIARQADVGIATLYRRFPRRSDLISAAFSDEITAYADAATAALDDPDPWDGFCSFVEKVAAMQSADRGFREVITMSLPTSAPFEAERTRAYRAFGSLIDKAQRAGRLRPDFVAEDLILLLMANAGVVAAGGETASRTSARLIAYLLSGFAAPGGPLPPPPSPSEVFTSLLRFQREGATDAMPGKLDE